MNKSRYPVFTHLHIELHETQFPRFQNAQNSPFRRSIAISTEASVLHEFSVLDGHFKGFIGEKMIIDAFLYRRTSKLVNDNGMRIREEQSEKQITQQGQFP